MGWHKEPSTMATTVSTTANRDPKLYPLTRELARQDAEWAAATAKLSALCDSGAILADDVLSLIDRAFDTRQVNPRARAFAGSRA